MYYIPTYLLESMANGLSFPPNSPFLLQVASGGRSRDGDSPGKQAHSPWGTTAPESLRTNNKKEKHDVEKRLKKNRKAKRLVFY